MDNGLKTEMLWWQVIGKSILLIVLVKWTYDLLFPAVGQPPWIVLDFVNLLIHEAGHLIFTPFGEFLNILGGSLTQIVLPMLFVYYFFSRQEYASTSFCVFWVGDNLINVSYYISDARAQSLPLISDGAIHDWNWLLTKLELLPYDHLFGTIVFGIGILLIITAFLLLLLSIYNSKENVTDSSSISA